MGKVVAVSLECGASDDDDSAVTVLIETETQMQPSEILSRRERKRLLRSGRLKVRSMAAEQSEVLVRIVEKIVGNV